MRCFQTVKTGSASNKAYITLFFTVAHSLEVCKDNAIRISGTKPKGLLPFSVFHSGASSSGNYQNTAFYLCAGCFIMVGSLYHFLSKCIQGTLWPFHSHNMVCICSIWAPLC